MARRSAIFPNCLASDPPGPESLSSAGGTCGLGVGDSCSTDQGTDVRNGLLDELLGESVGGHVSSDGDGLTSELLDLVDDLLSLGLVEIRDDDLGALLGEQERARATDALRGLFTRSRMWGASGESAAVSIGRGEQAEQRRVVDVLTPVMIATSSASKPLG